MNEPSEPTIETLQKQIEALQEQVRNLTREKQDLEMLMEMTMEHSDGLQNDLMTFNEQLELRVTERTAELKAAYETLEKMNQNKSVFIDLVAHELRTPLTVIKGNAQMLHPLIQKTNNSIMEHFANGLTHGAERMEAIVNSMLDIVKIENETLQLVKRRLHIWEIFERIDVGYRQALTRRKITMHTDINNLPAVQADPHLLYRAIDEIISNAIKYTPDKGHIYVHGTTHTDTDDTFLHLMIKDTGIGIDSDYHQLIFEKFYQLSRVEIHSSSRTNYLGGGPGLGLAVSKGIIESHNGRIWVESPGYDEESCPGSTFHILLPIPESQAYQILE